MSIRACLVRWNLSTGSADTSAAGGAARWTGCELVWRYGGPISGSGWAVGSACVSSQIPPSRQVHGTTRSLARAPTTAEFRSRARRPSSDPNASRSGPSPGAGRNSRADPLPQDRRPWLPRGLTQSPGIRPPVARSDDVASQDPAADRRHFAPGTAGLRERPPPPERRRPSRTRPSHGDSDIDMISYRYQSKQ